MDLLEGIYTRRSIRKYTNRPVEREQLMEIIRAGTWAPSGLNNQPWRFVIIKSSEVRNVAHILTSSVYLLRCAGRFRSRSFSGSKAMASFLRRSTHSSVF
jgi:nitroreductase